MFPGDPEPLKTIFALRYKDGYNSNVWTLLEHTATHVDAPYHFIEDGPTVDEMPVNTYVGWATVIDFSNLSPEHIISKEEIEKKVLSLPFKVGKGWILLLYTGYSYKAGTPEWLKYPSLSEEACEYIAELGVKGVGIDAPSPDRKPFPAHHIFLSRRIVIYENLINLEKLINKKFIFVGLPLKLVGGTASPIRAVALISK